MQQLFNLETNRTTKKYLITLSGAKHRSTKDLGLENYLSNKLNQSSSASFINKIFSLSLNVRLKRCLAFAAFFLLFLLAIFIMSKIYKNIIKIKERRKRYGYFLCPKYESVLYSLLSQTSLRAKTKAISVNFSLITDKIDSARTRFKDFREKRAQAAKYPRDKGHVNETFEINEIKVESNEDDALILNEEVVQELSEKKLGLLGNYLREKRINAFKYEKFKDDELSSVYNEDDEDEAESSRFLRPNNFSKLNKINKLTRFINRVYSKLDSESTKPLLSPTASYISKDSFVSSPETSISILSSSSKFSSNSASTLSFSLPLILITDTAKMYTSVVDLDTFEPESNISYAQRLLRLQLNEKRPK